MTYVNRVSEARYYFYDSSTVLRGKSEHNLEILFYVFKIKLFKTLFCKFCRNYNLFKQKYFSNDYFDATRKEVNKNVYRNY